MIAQVQPPRLYELFVNSTIGRDDGSGTADQPFKTITHALSYLASHRPGANFPHPEPANPAAAIGSPLPNRELVLIRLSAGHYTAEQGEVFPLQIPAHVSVLGDIPNRGQTTVITGSGAYQSPTFGPQQIAVCLGDGAHVRGVTITNPAPNGTGVWLESNGSALAHCTITQCDREGVFVTDRACPAIIDCIVHDNQAAGIAFVRYSKGEVRRCHCHHNRFGLVISDYAAPLIVENQFTSNQTGVILSGAASPVLRLNRLIHNTAEGLTVLHQAVPDLGNPQAPGENVMVNTGEWSLHNATDHTIVAVGNAIDPSRLRGAIDLQASLIDPDRLTALTRRPVPVPPGSVPPGSASRPAEHQASLPSPQPTIAPTPKLATVQTPPRGGTIASFWGLETASVERSWAWPFLQGLLTHQPALAAHFPEDVSASTGSPILAQSVSVAQFLVWLEQGLHLSMPLTALAPLTAESQLTRSQAIRLLVQGLGWGGGNLAVLSIYRDRAQIPRTDLSAIALATQHRLIALPQPDRLAPLTPLTLAELVALLYQVRVERQQVAPIASPHLVQPPLHSVAFLDSQEHWAAAFIQGLASVGIVPSIKGDRPNGRFLPERLLSRADYALLLATVFSPVAHRPAKAFTDVDASHWASAAIQQVYCGKLMGGFANHQFRPQQPVTRSQVLLSLVSALKSPEVPTSILNRFADVDAIPEAIRPAMAAAVGDWLVVTHPSLYQIRPHSIATRAEVAAMVYQALVRSGRAGAVPSAYIIDPTQPQQSLRDRKADVVVVLDPGHGGADMGAIGMGRSPSAAALIPPERPSEQSEDLPDSLLGNLSGPRPGSGIPTLPPGMEWGIPKPPSPDLSPRPASPPPPSTLPHPALGGPPLPGRLPPGLPGSIPGRSPLGMAAPPPAMPIVREKDVVMSIALEVAALLRPQGIRVLLTRSDDRYLNSIARAQLAAQVNADVFVSLHTNATPSYQPEVNGLETYHARSPRSQELAEAIHQTILNRLDIVDRHIQPAYFPLLRSVSMPAAHLELGYLTGSEDGINVTDPDYRRELAQAIAQGILQFVHQVMVK